jgi:hypothetical protein
MVAASELGLIDVEGSPPAKPAQGHVARLQADSGAATRFSRDVLSARCRRRRALVFETTDVSLYVAREMARLYPERWTYDAERRELVVILPPAIEPIGAGFAPRGGRKGPRCLA